MSNSVLVFAAAGSYLAGGFSTGLRLFNPRSDKRPPRALGIVLGFLGLAIHALLLLQQNFLETGLNLGFFHAVSLVAWTILLVLMLSTLSKPLENLGILLLPIGALTVVLAHRFPSVHLLPADANWALRIHVLVSLLAYSLLSLASVQAIMLAIQDKHLHSRHPGGFVRALPPLQTMESLLFEMIAVGFGLLTAALLTGFMFLEDMFAQHLVHKTLLSIVSWLTFGVLLWGRFRFGWRGRKALRWTLVGFVVLMLAYFGSKAVMELILNR